VAEKTRSRKDEAPAGGVVPKVALSYEEAAWSLGISKSKLYRLVSEGRLPCVTIDGNTVLRLSDLERFVEQNIKLRGSGKERPVDA
jgi:excisionase family DNA binding protein